MTKPTVMEAANVFQRDRTTQQRFLKTVVSHRNTMTKNCYNREMQFYVYIKLIFEKYIVNVKYVRWSY